MEPEVEVICVIRNSNLLSYCGYVTRIEGVDAETLTGARMICLRLCLRCSHRTFLYKLELSYFAQMKKMTQK